MKYLIAGLILFNISFASSLKSLLNKASRYNDIIKANETTLLSTKKSIDSINKSYYPTLDVGALIQDSNPRALMRPGITAKAFVKLNYIIFDGGVKKYNKKAKYYELSSLRNSNKEYKENLYIQIMQDFYALETLYELIKSLEFKKRAIKAQLKKIKAFYKAGIVGEVELYQLQSALENVKYNLNSLSLKKKTLLMQLSLKVGKRVKKITPSYFKKRKVAFSPNATVALLKAKKASIFANAKAIEASNNAKVNVSLEHDRFAYGRYDRLHPEGLSEQTTLTISASKRLYDGGATKKKAQAVKLQALSLEYKIKNALKTQKMQFNLAKLRIKNVKVQIKSAKAALVAAKKNYEANLKKYSAGIIDSSEYLDALSNYAQAKANYKKALNDLEVAYGLYYFNAGKNIKRYLK
jgi:outer membrane protein TolC